METSASGYRPLVPTFSPYTADSGTALRLAWRVTLAAFALLLVLAIGGPLARNWYVGAAIERRMAQMSSIDGVVFVQRQGAGDWLMAKPEDQIAPGDVLRTAANARAFVRLFDESTVLLYPSSSARVLRADQGRFKPEKTVVVVEVTQGRARIGVAPPRDPDAAFFQLRTPNAEVHLAEGSYAADYGKGITQVSVRVGEATAYTQWGSATAHLGQRVVAQSERPPLGAQPARRDLVENGLFAEKDGARPQAWVDRDLSEPGFPSGTWSLTSIPGAVTFERVGKGHGETVLSQIVGADLWDFDHVALSAKLRVLEHSLSGGGWVGTEYPLLLRVIYKDATGGVNTWTRGFYLHNQDGYPVQNAQQLPSSDWQTVDIDLLSLAPRPWQIQRVEVVASGWDYRSALSELHIWAE